MNSGLALRAPIGLRTCLRHARPLQPGIARVSSLNSLNTRPLQHIQQAGPVPRPAQEGAAAAAAETQVCHAADYSYAPTSFGDPGESSKGLGEAARQSLGRATSALRRYGWLAFWIQLSLSIVSGVILLFSVAFTSQSGPKASLYLTLVGILAGFLSTFWSFGYQRTAAKMQEYLDGANVAKVKKQQVVEMVTRGVLINLVGLGSTLVGISTLVGLLVAKTLSNATINPFLASAAGGYNPVLALDVFLVQAATNTLLGHFLALLCSLWLLNVLGEGRGLRFQRQKRIMALKQQTTTGGISGLSGTVKGNAGVYQLGDTLAGLANRARRGGGGGGGGSGGGGGGGEAGSGRAGQFRAQAVASARRRGGGSGLSSSSSSSSSMPAALPRGRPGAPVVSAASVLLPNALEGEWARSSSPIPSSSSGPSSSLSSWEEDVEDLRQLRPPSSPAQRLQRDFLVLPSEASLTYLDGSLPGDYGFDPLGLYSPEVAGGVLGQRWLAYSEVLHSRWAMLGVVGCLAPEALGAAHIIPPATALPWYASGWLPPAGTGLVYWATPQVLCAVAVVMMGFAEWARWQDYRQPGSMAAQLSALEEVAGQEWAGSFAGSGAPAYPGGPLFNAWSFAESGPAMASYMDAEIKHGRLAMLAMLGFGAQAVMTGEGPWSNLQHHLASPAFNNILTGFGEVLGPLPAGGAPGRGQV